MPTSFTSISIREAKKLARQARQHGYHRASATQSYVFCPLCRERIYVDHRGGESGLARVLDPAVIEHLTDTNLPIRDSAGNITAPGEPLCRGIVWQDSLETR